MYKKLNKKFKEIITITYNTKMRQTSNNHNNRNNNAYVPPNKREKPTASPRTEKKELKKEFSTNNPLLFPTLGETIQKSSQACPIISFSSAAAKKIEAPPPPIKSEVAPGWVHIRKHNGIIQYKYGPEILKKDYTEEEDKFICDALLKYRFERQQYENDMDVERLGDLSDYYDEPTLVEIQEEYERLDTFKEEMNYGSSGESDTD